MQPPAPRLSLAGEPILIMTTNEVPGRSIQVLGMVRDRGDAWVRGCGNEIGAAALRSYPNTDAVVGYSETPLYPTGLVCNGTAVQFVN